MTQIEDGISGNITCAAEMCLTSKIFYDNKKVRILEIVLICTLLFVLKFHDIRIKKLCFIVEMIIVLQPRIISILKQDTI